MKRVWPWLAILGLIGCGDPDASCTTSQGTEQQICYELGPGNDDVSNVEATCSNAGGTFAEEPCDTSGAAFECTDTLFNFYVPAAANGVRTLRFNYYIWNPAAQAGGACVNTGGVWTSL